MLAWCDYRSIRRIQLGTVYTTVAVAGTDAFKFCSDLYREPGAREYVNRPSALGFRVYVRTFRCLNL